MVQHFTTKRDLIGGFTNAMNLISPEVQNHHEKVSYLAYRLAEASGLDDHEKMLAFTGGLLHDIGGVLKQGDVSLLDLELNAGQVASAGAALLRVFPATSRFAPVVQESQTPWQRLKRLHAHLKAPQQIGQCIHLADAITLLLEVLESFETLCKRESVWMDVMYRPQLFLELIQDNRWVTLDETVKLTEFMSKIIDFRSPFTAMHSAGVAATAVALAELLGMSSDECKMMRIAGYVHDIGKLKIPDEILEKPGKLTDEEFNIMKEHAYYTWILLKDVKGFEQIAPWAAFHHEKLNGNGYPFHLTEGELHLGSRIMTIADIFSAITEDRPYRKSMEKEKVIAILLEDTGRGLLSESLVDLLIDHYDSINARRDAESKAASKKYQESLSNR